MSALRGRVAIVTGAGGGLGRAHALLLAKKGASVVVNDLGTDVRGEGASINAAQRVVAEIEAGGGCAIASGHDVADWEQAHALVRLAVDRFGKLDVLVNNAGILRDRTLANVSETEWDAVIRVHLKGHAATTHHAMAYWRDRAKAGHEVKASVVHTTSVAGFAGNFGQASYAAAKLGIAGLSRVVALEGAKYGVRSNAVSPSAYTRLETTLRPAPNGEFDVFRPANVSPLIAWLAKSDCPANSQVFQIYGNRLLVIQLAAVAHRLEVAGQWTMEAIDHALPSVLLQPPQIADFVEGLPVGGSA